MTTRTYTSLELFFDSDERCHRAVLYSQVVTAEGYVVRESQGWSADELPQSLIDTDIPSLVAQLGTKLDVDAPLKRIPVEKDAK